MKKIKHYEHGDPRQKAQGDMYIIKIDSVDSSVQFSPLKDRAIVGHSETGHHHVIVKDREKTSDVEIAKDTQGYFIRVNKGSVDLVHEKSGGHETQKIEQGVYFIGHQMEYSDSDDRKVID